MRRTQYGVEALRQKRPIPTRLLERRQALQDLGLDPQDAASVALFLEHRVRAYEMLGPGATFIPLPG